MLDLVIVCICAHNMSNVNYDVIYINWTLNTQEETQAKANSTFNIKWVNIFKMIKKTIKQMKKLQNPRGVYMLKSFI